MAKAKKTAAKPAAKAEVVKTSVITAKSVIRGLIAKAHTDAFIIDATMKAMSKQGRETLVDEKHMAKYRRELFLEGGETTPILASVKSPAHRDWALANRKMAVTKKCPHHEYWIATFKAEKEAAVEKAAAAKAKKAA